MSLYIYRLNGHLTEILKTKQAFTGYNLVDDQFNNYYFDFIIFSVSNIEVNTLITN